MLMSIYVVQESPRLPLDILKEQPDCGDQEEMFDTDFAIMTGEIQKLLADIIDALGSETNLVNILKAA
jgi:DNA recombination-dependent growth factor C